MRILIATTHVPFVYGGAEVHADSLKQALVERGHEVELALIPFKWYPPDKLHEHLLACRLLDLKDSNGVPIDKVIGLKFPAYHVRHPNKVLWVLHQFRTAFEMWRSEFCDISVHPEGKEIRDSIAQIDRNLLPEARAIFANSQTVANRLERFSGISAEPLYHPPQNSDKFYHREAEDFLYYPSRVNQLKRQRLVVEALAQTKEKVQVRFSGASDNPQFVEDLKSLAVSLKVDRRIQWLGRISFDNMLENYAKCLSVIFVPEQEDYGYITLEAMLSQKPVITCLDSGGPLEFVDDKVNGLVAEPTPDSLAAAMDEMWKSRSFAKEAGIMAKNRYNELEISWDNVVNKLLQ